MSEATSNRQFLVASDLEGRSFYCIDVEKVYLSQVVILTQLMLQLIIGLKKLDIILL